MESYESIEAVSLAHLQRLSDSFGIIQHAKYATPDYRTGYCTDDNARALIVAAKHYQLFGDEVSLELANRYLAFLHYAQKEDGRFHNFFGYDRRALEEVGSEDTLGRALWGLAYLINSPPKEYLLGPAEELLHRALPWIEKVEHPRGRALCVIALYWWSRASRGDSARARLLAAPLADYLVDRYHESRRPGWDWILPEMTYANAKLPEALFRAYQMLGDEKYLEVARRTLQFLRETTFVEDVFSCVGNNGWCDRGQTPVLYDQQPIEAAGMVHAALAGFEATGENNYLGTAMLAWEWFMGRNLQKKLLFDSQTGGCFDGLMEHGVNQNRGAESTICMLMAKLSLLSAQKKITQLILS